MTGKRGLLILLLFISLMSAPAWSDSSCNKAYCDSEDECSSGCRCTYNRCISDESSDFSEKWELISSMDGHSRQPVKNLLGEISDRL
uniref:Hypothetical secreted protein n=1 Tax=Ornithodoros coriaceus TaxID=92741 RepID=B2D2G1_ORNCO|nr:hypothetical secreted protein precursor [Ornithodoros coriaceus]